MSRGGGGVLIDPLTWGAKHCVNSIGKADLQCPSQLKVYIYQKVYKKNQEFQKHELCLGYFIMQSGPCGQVHVPTSRPTVLFTVSIFNIRGLILNTAESSKFSFQIH